MPASGKMSIDARKAASAKNWRIAELPALRPLHRMEVRPHLEASFFIVSPPSRKARQLPGACVALVNKTSSNASRTAVQIFIAAPDRKIGPPIVKPQRQIPGRMGQIEADDASLCDARLFVIPAMSNAWPVT